MSATGEQRDEVPFDLSPPPADSMEAAIPEDLKAVPLVLDRAVDGATLRRVEPVSNHVSDAPNFVPTLEDLAQDWLSEPTDVGTDVNDGSGGLDVAELAARADEATPPPLASSGAMDPAPGSAAAWARVDTTTEFSASAVARIEARSGVSSSGSAAVPVDDFSPDASRFRRSRWVGGALIGAALAGGVALFVMRQPQSDAADEDEAAGVDDESRSPAPPPAEVDAASKAGPAPSGAPLNDGLAVTRFEVGLPGAGKTCDGDRTSFSRDTDRKIAACYAVDQPHQADRVIVLWEREDKTVRRGVKDAPRAARLVSRSFLSLHEQPTGPWTVRLVRDDGGTLTELARRQIVIEP